MKIRLIHWDVDAWKEYCDWQKRDKSVVIMISACLRTKLRIKCTEKYERTETRGSM